MSSFQGIREKKKRMVKEILKVMKIRKDGMNMEENSFTEIFTKSQMSYKYPKADCKGNILSIN